MLSDSLELCSVRAAVARTVVRLPGDLQQKILLQCSSLLER